GGHFGGFSADEGDVGFGAGGTHAFNEGLDDGGVDLVDAEVVEEGEGAGAHDGDVAGDGGYEVAAEIFVRFRRVDAGGNEGLGAAAVGGLDHDGVGEAFE